MEPPNPEGAMTMNDTMGSARFVGPAAGAVHDGQQVVQRWGETVPSGQCMPGGQGPEHIGPACAELSPEAPYTPGAHANG